MHIEKAIREFFGLLQVVDYRPERDDTDPEGMVRAWCGLCRHLSPQEFTVAAGIWLRQDRFKRWPSPGAVIQVATEQRQAQVLAADEARGLLLKQASGPRHCWVPCETEAEANGVEARWANGQDLDGFMSHQGTFVVHSDPQVAAGMMAGIRALGGWQSFGRQDPSDPSARKAFRDAYNAASRKAASIERLGATGPARQLEVRP